MIHMYIYIYIVIVIVLVIVIVIVIVIAIARILISSPRRPRRHPSSRRCVACAARGSCQRCGCAAAARGSRSTAPPVVVAPEAATWAWAPRAASAAAGPPQPRVPTRRAPSGTVSSHPRRPPRRRPGAARGLRRAGRPARPLPGGTPPGPIHTYIMI